MTETEDRTHLSYGTEVQQWFVNSNGKGFWLTQIRRDTRGRVKVRLRNEDYYELRDAMDKAINDMLRRRESQSDVYRQTPATAGYRRKP